MSDTNANREHKDRLFTFLFSQPDHHDWMISLINAISGSNYPLDQPIQLTTLDDVLYITMKNDVSYIIDNQMILLEHQSSFNPNMPLRGFLYFARLYQAYIDEQGEHNLYQSRVLQIPTPRFYVIYNGLKETDDQVKLRLSDAYFHKDNQTCREFEWTATMLNINKGHNENLLAVCQPLREYQEFVTLVRRGQTEKHLSLAEAINRALDEVIAKNYLDGLFKKFRREIVDILTHAYTDQEAEELYRLIGYEDGYETGRTEGYETGREAGIELQRQQDEAVILAKDAEIDRLKALLAERNK